MVFSYSSLQKHIFHPKMPRRKAYLKQRAEHLQRGVAIRIARREMERVVGEGKELTDEVSSFSFSLSFLRSNTHFFEFCFVFFYCSRKLPNFKASGRRRLWEWWRRLSKENFTSYQIANLWGWWPISIIPSLCFFSVFLSLHQAFGFNSFSLLLWIYLYILYRMDFSKRIEIFFSEIESQNKALRVGFLLEWTVTCGWTAQTNGFLGSFLFFSFFYPPFPSNSPILLPISRVPSSASL